jgi:hypothetical protein
MLHNAGIVLSLSLYSGGYYDGECDGRLTEFDLLQVRQKSKSVGKWSCVVCNQRQSLRKVFAQGFMAKDLRRFVQSFNMSRDLSDHLQTPLPHSTDEEDIADDRFQCNNRSKRRSDWSEYLDSEDHDRVKEEIGIL